MKVCLIAMEVLIPPSSVIMSPYRRCKKTRRGKKRKCKYDDGGDEEFGSCGGNYKRQTRLQSPTSPLLPSSSPPSQYVTEELLPVTNLGSREEPDFEQRLFEEYEQVKDNELNQKEEDIVDEEEEVDNDEDSSGIAVSREEVPASLQANRRFLRPFDVPKAPSNSTQFIIDDHENCNLYLSFEKPSSRSPAYTCHNNNNNEVFSYEDQGYWDIDYEYESPDDVDTTVAFFERDFEMIYNRAREEELLAVARMNLIEQFVELEERATHLEDLLSVKGTTTTTSSDEETVIVPFMDDDISYLQGELLRLQEENLSLRRCNRNLKRGSEEKEDDEL